MVSESGSRWLVIDLVAATRSFRIIFMMICVRVRCDEAVTGAPQWQWHINLHATVQGPAAERDSRCHPAASLVILSCFWRSALAGPSPAGTCRRGSPGRALPVGRRRGPGPAGPDAMPMPPICPPAAGPGSASPGADRTQRKFPGPAAPGRAVPQAMGLGMLPLTGPLPS